MKLRTARILVAGYFAVMLAVVTWPGILPFARIRPLVLGLPFTFAWIALWVLGSVLVLWWADRVEARHRRGEAGGTAGDPGPGPLPGVGARGGSAPGSDPARREGAR